MPRGQKKRGAIDCKIWFEDGAFLSMTSHPDKVFTNAELAQMVRDNILKALEPSEKANG